MSARAVEQIESDDMDRQLGVYTIEREFRTALAVLPSLAGPRMTVKS
jgi:hypothetical protein